MLSVFHYIKNQSEAFAYEPSFYVTCLSGIDQMWNYLFYTESNGFGCNLVIYVK